MKSRLRTFALSFSCLLFAAGCGSSGGGNLTLELQQCMGSGLLEFYGMLLRFSSLPFDLNEDPLLPGVEVSATLDTAMGVDPFTYDFTITIDSDLDGTVDQTYTGRVTFSDDPTDGLNPDATADVTVSRAGAGGETSTAALAIQLQGGFASMRVSGTFANTAGGCTVNLDMDDLNPLIVLFPFLQTAPMPVGIPPFGFNGTLSALAQEAGHSLDALLQFLPNSGQIAFSSMVLDGGDLPDANVDLLPTASVLGGVALCTEDLFSGLFDVGSTFAEVLDAFAMGSTTIPDGTFTLTPAGGTAFDFTIMLDEGGGVTTTVTGRVTFSSIPGTTPYTGTAAVSFTASTSGSTATTSSPASDPLVLSYDMGSFFRISGTLTESDPMTGCSGTLTIPASNPLEDGQAVRGIMNVTVDLDGDELALQLVFPVGGSIGGLTVASASLNGFPFPPELLSFFLLVPI